MKATGDESLKTLDWPSKRLEGRTENEDIANWICYKRKMKERTSCKSTHKADGMYSMIWTAFHQQSDISFLSVRREKKKERYWPVFWYASSMSAWMTLWSLVHLQSVYMLQMPCDVVTHAWNLMKALESTLSMYALFLQEKKINSLYAYMCAMWVQLLQVKTRQVVVSPVSRDSEPY